LLQTKQLNTIDLLSQQIIQSKPISNIHRYLLSFKAKDETAEGRFFAYDDEAQQMVQKECEAIFNPLNPRDVLPVPLQKIINKKYVLSVDLTNEACKTTKYREYLVKAVLEKPSVRDVAQNPLLIEHGTMEQGGTGTSTEPLAHQTDVLQIEAAGHQVYELPIPSLS
jgi:hypothetical protein